MCLVNIGVWNHNRLLAITPYLDVGEVYTLDVDISSSDYLMLRAYNSVRRIDDPDARPAWGSVSAPELCGSQARARYPTEIEGFIVERKSVREV